MNSLVIGGMSSHKDNHKATWISSNHGHGFTLLLHDVRGSEQRSRCYFWYNLVV